MKTNESLHNTAPGELVDSTTSERYQPRPTMSMKSPTNLIPTTTVTSRISAFSAALVEACWLLAVALVPVLHDPNAFPSFQPVKITTLRTLGLVVAGALLVAAVENLGGRSSVSARSTPSGRWMWWTAAALLLASFLIPTLFSIDPLVSIWGLMWNGQGTVTFCCQLGLGMGVAIFLRTEAQLDRLITVALAASAPVALYGILQWLQIDPLFGLQGQKAQSFAGHPIVLGGYVMMLVPLSAYRCWAAARWPATAYYIALLTLQMWALIAADKRGPFVAMCVTAAAGLILVAVRTRRLRLAIWGIVIAIGFGGLIVSLAVMKRTGAIDDKAPILGTLSQIVPLAKETNDGTGDGYRKAIWQRAPEIVLGVTPWIFPDGTRDAYHFLRPLVGYGPETLQGVLPQHWPFGGDGPGVSRIENRFHNYFWDTWQATGLLGLAALLWLYGGLFARGFERAGLIAGRDGIRVLATSGAGAVVGGGVLSLAYGPGYFGLGFQVGMAVGLVLWPGWRAWRGIFVETNGRDLKRDLLLIALLVSLLGHWVDMAFVFPSGNTAALFWVFAGAVIGTICRSASAEKSDPIVAPWFAPSLLTGLIAGATLLGLVHGAVEGASVNQLAVWDILKSSLFEDKFKPQAGHQLSLFYLPSWLLMVAGLNLGTRFARVGDRIKGLLLTGGVSLLIGVAYAWWKARCLAGLGPIPAVSATAETAVAFANGVGTISVGMLGGCVLAVAAVAGVLFFDRGRGQLAPATWLGRGALLVAGAAVCGGCWFAAAEVLRARTVTFWASRFESHGRKEQAVAIYESCHQSSSFGTWDRHPCADLIAELADRANDEASFSAGMAHAISVLEEGRQRSQLNPVDFHLGQIFLRWAQRTSDPDARKARLLQARQALRRATTFAPETEGAWFEASIVDRELGDVASADRNLARADALSEKLDPMLWGDLYRSRSLTSKAPLLKQAFARRALSYITREVAAETERLQRAQVELKKIRQTTYPRLVAQGTLQFTLGENEAARDSFKKAIEAGPETKPWQAEAMLANVYAVLGDRMAAIASVNNALQNCPKESQRDLAMLRMRLLQNPAAP